jgi:uncharacterized protein YnzC (UPF0291/DUF896 family)
MSKKEISGPPGKIVPIPEHEELRSEIEKLRVELSMLVFERDELMLVASKNIEMAYMLSVGGLEYKAYELECTVLRLKRKADLIQARKNRQEKVILSDIEKALDVEFAEYQAKLDEKIRKMNDALERSKGQILTDQENAELKKLYRAIVKELHPDLHPNLSEAKVRLFQSAVEAYEFGDLEGLRVIAEMVGGSLAQEEGKDTSSHLLKEKERLTKLICAVNKRIASIKSEYPYILKSIVEDPEMITEKKNELEVYIQELKEVQAVYTSKIAEMLR